MKNINWNKFTWNSLKVLLILILNTPLLVFLIGSFVPYGKIGEFRLSWIDYLKLSDKVEWYQIWILYMFIPIGLGLSIGFVKWLVIEAKKEKRHQEVLKENKKNMEELKKEISNKEQEELEKQIKKVKKYLGD